MGAFQGLAEADEFGDYTELHVPGFGVVKNFFEAMVVLIDDAVPEGWRVSRKVTVQRGQLRYGEELVDWIEQDEFNYALVSTDVIRFIRREETVELDRIFAWNKSRSLISPGKGMNRLPGRYSFRRPNGIENIVLYSNDYSHVP